MTAFWGRSVAIRSGPNGWYGPPALAGPMRNALGLELPRDCSSVPPAAKEKGKGAVGAVDLAHDAR